MSIQSFSNIVFIGESRRINYVEYSDNPLTVLNPEYQVFLASQLPPTVTPGLIDANEQDIAGGKEIYAVWDTSSITVPGKYMVYLQYELNGEKRIREFLFTLVEKGILR